MVGSVSFLPCVQEGDPWQAMERSVTFLDPAFQVGDRRPRTDQGPPPTRTDIGLPIVLMTITEHRPVGLLVGSWQVANFDAKAVCARHV